MANIDYTSTTLVKAAIGATASGKDSLIATFVTAASRAIDRYVTGSRNADSDNYFHLDNVVDEVQRVDVYKNMLLRVFPHKPNITVVTALSYRAAPNEVWSTADVAYAEIEGGNSIAWYGGGYSLDDTMQVKVSYTGGYATSQSGLPSDLIEAATVLAARYFREAMTGLSDAIGVTELGILTYTKSMPSRVREMLQPYKRVVPW